MLEAASAPARSARGGRGGAGARRRSTTRRCACSRGAGCRDPAAPRSSATGPSRTRPSDGVEEAWPVVYRDPDAHWDLYQLGEELIDLEDAFRLWRFRHVTTVERVIGFKRGTGGTAASATCARCSTSCCSRRSGSCGRSSRPLGDPRVLVPPLGGAQVPSLVIADAGCCRDAVKGRCATARNVEAARVALTCGVRCA